PDEEGTSTPPAPFFASSTSGTSTPRFEPTFAFDTPNLSPLPQPEERAYLEELRERKQYTHRRRSSTGDFDDHPTEDDRQLSPRSTRGRPIPAAEAVATVVSPVVHVSARSPSPSSPSSLAISPSPESLPALLPPFSADDPISCTPPSFSESYLELEPVGVDEVWTQWAKGTLPPPASVKKATAGEGDEYSTLAFLD
ncbi:hypothetical protein JCM11641_001807, partial [Rhodosporidiobolus odoratus]